MSLSDCAGALSRRPVPVLGLSALAFAMACSAGSAKSGGGGPQDPGQTAPTDTGIGNVNPYGVAYPSQPPFKVAGGLVSSGFGFQPRKCAAPPNCGKAPAGDVISNFKFLGYPNSDTSKGLQPVALADYLDPETRQYKVLHISVGGNWCYWCQQEQKALEPLLPQLKTMKVAYLFALSDGAQQGTPAKNSDLLSWISLYHATDTSVLDPGGHNLGPFFDSASLPFNANIDVRTMEILAASNGAPADSTGTIDIIGDVKPWVDFVDQNPIQTQ
jgi:hypothetical protein